MKRKTLIFICAVILACVPAAVFALTRAVNLPADVSGGFASLTVDRVDITLDATRFVYRNVTDGNYDFSFVFTVKKTEPDFYARIDSFELDGIDYDSVVFEALGETPDGSGTDGTVLSADDGQPISYSWRVTVFTSEKPEKGSVRLKLTSGVTQLTAETVLREVPLEFIYE